MYIGTHESVAHYKGRYLPLSETFIYEFIKKLRFYKPIVLTRATENLSLFPIENLHCIPRNRQQTLQQFLNGVSKYFRSDSYFECVMKRERVQLIHAHFGDAGLKMLPIKKRLNLLLVTSFYGYDATRLAQDPEYRRAYQQLFEEGDVFLAEGNCMKEKLIRLGCPPGKIRILHIGVDVRRFKYYERNGTNGSKTRILFCGRFTEKKGLFYALKAVGMLLKGGLPVEFRVIGDGELMQEVDRYIRTNDLIRQVTLLGSLPHYVYAEELRRADLLIQPSITARSGDSEGGAPTVLLEAQATGLPVISTLHDDIPEAVLNGTSGFLVPERDWRALAQKIKELVSQPAVRAGMGKRGRKHIEENYNIYNEVKKLEDIYSDLLH